MKFKNCICCGENNWSLYTRLPKFIFGNSAKIVKCKYCGLGATIPEPNVYVSYYENNVQYENLFGSKESLYRGFAQELLSTLSTLIKPNHSKLLDVGCGAGYLVETAAEQGYEALGLEANQSLVQYAQSKGINVVKDDVTSLSMNSSSKFEVIVISAVLEHLNDPGQLIRDCIPLLEEGGLVLISQASYDGLLPRLFPWIWYGWQPREHFWHFTPRSFQIFADNSGYQVIKVQRNTLYHPWYKTGGIKNVLGRNLAALVAKIGNKIGEGDSFNIILRPVFDGE